MINRLIFCLILPGLLFTGCRNKKEYAGFNGFIQGSTYSVVYEVSKRTNPEELREKTERILADFDNSLSLYNDSSVLCKINRNEEVTPDSFFIEVFNESARISAMTGGAFDVTVAPLVRAWGFGPDARKSFSESKRDSLLQLVGMDKVSLKGGKLVKTDPRVTLDFNAIAQGYSVDVIARFLDSQGIKNYLVEIGGEVRAKGKKAGNFWRIGIDKPVDNNNSPGQDLQAIIQLSDKSLATSGNYRKFYVENGIKYSHEIDPKTGYPARNTILSTTIRADDCGTADAVATACMVMGMDKTIDFLKDHPEFQAYIIYSDNSGDFKTWSSDEFRKYISGID